MRGVYERILPDADGGVTSEELGIRFILENGALAMFDAATGERLLTQQEWENQRADKEKHRADGEKQCADEEKQRADLAEQKAKNLAEELARLKESAGRLNGKK